MRYSGYKCDGCGKAFNEDDDIVVCPECATPQHRECYNEKGGCVNAHLHSEDFQWQGEKTALPTEPQKEEIAPAEIRNDLICPNCHHANPHGSTECQKCGMKFTIFGINLAEKAQEAENENDDAPVNPLIRPKMTPPDYAPPFTVGSGEEEKESDSLPSSREEQVNNFLSQTISNTSGYDAAENEDNLFKGPFPDDMKIDGIPANTMGAFLAKESGKYIEKFRKLSNGSKLSFNWAAFFLSPYWFFYRKQWRPGIIFLTLQLCLNIVMTPSATAFLEYYERLANIDTATITEAVAAEIMAEMTTLMQPMWIFFGIMFALRLIAGFIANPLYRKYTVRELQLVSLEKNRSQKLTRILKYGGISPLMPLAAYFAEQFLSLLSGYFF